MRDFCLDLVFLDGVALHEIDGDHIESDVVGPHCDCQAFDGLFVVVRLAHAVGEEKDAFFCLLVSLVVEQSDASANGPENIAALFFVVEPGVAHLVHSFEQN
jgi:hypothetical protein